VVPTILILTLGLLLAAPLAAAPAEAPPAPASPAEARAQAEPLAKPLAITVRSAPLSDVLARASRASGVMMTATGPAADQRVTLHAGRATAGELQAALRSLLRLRTSRRGEGAEERFVFSQDPRLAAAAEAWRLRQADAAGQAVLRTAGAFASGREEASVRTLSQRFRQEHPEFPASALAALDADYLRQSLLFLPLTPARRAQLGQTGWLSFPLAWLPPAEQMLLAQYGQGGDGRVTLDAELWEDGLMAPRVQYRLLYGDRWTDRMLLAQVGAPGSWTSSMLPSVLFRQRDDSSLYSPAEERPDDPDVWRRLPPRVEIAGKDWDSVLIELAKSMQIRLAADSYARPWLFNTDRPLPEIGGIPLRDALDRLCQAQGYFWWKQDGWYFLRSRTWVEESRVAVPDRLLRQWVAAIQEDGALAEQELLQMAALTDEQLLTLDLQSRPPGSAEFLGPGFDPEAAALMANSLLLFRSLPSAQRELALADGLPAVWLPPAQQNLFAAVAAQYRIALLPEDAESWRFRIRQSFPPPRERDTEPPGARLSQRVSGTLTAEWRFGNGLVVRAPLLLGDRPLHQTMDTAIPPIAR
jgi:hypothetical protein